MSDAEVALELLKLALPNDSDAQTDCEKLLALYRKCLAAVRDRKE